MAKDQGSSWVLWNLRMCKVPLSFPFPLFLCRRIDCIQSTESSVDSWLLWGCNVDLDAAQENALCFLRIQCLLQVGPLFATGEEDDVFLATGCSTALVGMEWLPINWVRHFGHPLLLWCDGIFILLARVIGESIWKTLETHSNKTNTILKVLKPDTTYQVKVQVQCLSKSHNTNDIVTLRTPEGRECQGRFWWHVLDLMWNFWRAF